MRNWWTPQIRAFVESNFPPWQLLMLKYHENRKKRHVHMSEERCFAFTLLMKRMENLHRDRIPVAFPSLCKPPPLFFQFLCKTISTLSAILNEGQTQQSLSRSLPGFSLKMSFRTKKRKKKKKRFLMNSWFFYPKTNLA